MPIIVTEEKAFSSNNHANSRLPRSQRKKRGAMALANHCFAQAARRRYPSDSRDKLMASKTPFRGWSRARGP
jgi:hypothetical protein